MNAAGINAVPYDADSVMRSDVLPILIDAAAAVLVNDQLEKQDFDALMAGWRFAIEAVAAEETG